MKSTLSVVRVEPQPSQLGSPIRLPRVPAQTPFAERLTPTVAPEILCGPDGQFAWRRHLSGEIRHTGATSGGKVFVGTPHSLHAVDLTSGADVWTRAAKARRSLFTAEGRILVCERSQVVAFDTATGREEWKRSYRRPLPVAGENGAWLVVAGHGSTGSSRFDWIRADGTLMSGGLICGRAGGTPCVDGPRGYLRLRDGRIARVDRNGTHRVSTGTRDASEPAVRGGTIYVQRSPSHPIASEWNEAPRVLADAIICADRHRIISFQPSGQALRWMRRIVRDDSIPALLPPVVTSARIYVATTDGQVAILDRESGELLWTVSAGGELSAEPLVADGFLIVATRAGTLLAMEVGDLDPMGWTMAGGGAARRRVE
ncbi:MAG: PQQ-binding-like beta-propeller repeat protein [Planctomycetota bacterium]